MAKLTRHCAVEFCTQLWVYTTKIASTCTKTAASYSMSEQEISLLLFLYKVIILKFEKS